ncbi:hypothetical protein POM88_008029 [Heracleum sosnowskyi]|uniref:Uncharacterized protein n=1 Tax=Heracleum sosnowskyi TaxID=360622 RepID=A0AAD8J6N5_9APIA|nr:hypothetical protein POM88_008029 [Heracleum sosnowskyi]
MLDRDTKDAAKCKCPTSKHSQGATEMKFELEQREKELQKREARNDSERKKLTIEKEINERATLEQKKADEKVFKLAEDHKFLKGKSSQWIGVKGMGELDENPFLAACDGVFYDQRISIVIVLGLWMFVRCYDFE